MIVKYFLKEIREQILISPKKYSNFKYNRIYIYILHKFKIN